MAAKNTKKNLIINYIVIDLRNTQINFIFHVLRTF